MIRRIFGQRRRRDEMVSIIKNQLLKHLSKWVSISFRFFFFFFNSTSFYQLPVCQKNYRLLNVCTYSTVYGRLRWELTIVLARLHSFDRYIIIRAISIYKAEGSFHSINKYKSNRQMCYCMSFENKIMAQWQSIIIWGWFYYKAIFLNYKTSLFLQ